MSLDSISFNDLGIINGLMLNYSHSVFTQTFMAYQICVQSTFNLKRLLNLDTSKATGIGAISPEVLKQCGCPITPVFFPVVCISLCSIPDKWLRHINTKVRTKDRHQELSSYFALYSL